VERSQKCCGAAKQLLSAGKINNIDFTIQVLISNFIKHILHPKLDHSEEPCFG
jgi:hypothetical protein